MQMHDHAAQRVVFCMMHPLPVHQSAVAPNVQDP